MSKISRRDFLLNSLLAGVGIFSGAALSYPFIRHYFKNARPEIDIPQEGASYFLGREDIEHFVSMSENAAFEELGNEMQYLLHAEYQTHIPYSRNSTYQVNRLFAETPIGIELVPYYNLQMRYAEASYEVRQASIATLGDASPFAVPMNRADYSAGISDIAERAILFTGDSFTYAVGVDYEDSFANRLGGQKHLNFAVFGHGTEDQLRRLNAYLSLDSRDDSLAGKVLMHCIHPNDLINDLVTNFYWQFYNQTPHSYNSDFTPRFANLLQGARDNNHEGLAYFALSPGVTSSANRIIMNPYQYDPTEARFVPQLTLSGVQANPIICDPEMHYFAGTIDDLAASQGFDVSSLIDEGDFATEIKFRYADGSIAATGYHRLGGFDSLDLSIRRLSQIQEIVQARGGTFIAFRLGTFEDYAYEYLNYESAMRQVFGAVMPEDINPHPLRERFIARVREQAITIYDLVPEMLESARIFAGMNKTLYYLTDTHLSPAGHLLTAGLMKLRLKENHADVYRLLS